MKRLSLTAAAIALIAMPLALAQDSQPASAPAEEPTAMYPDCPQIGETVADFNLPNVLDENQAAVSLSGVLAENDFAVLIWHSIECPWVVPLEPVLPGMASEWGEEGVQFIAINSNNTEDPATIAEQLSGFNFPVLYDEGNAIADQYGATRTPEVFVVDSEMNLRFHGRINDDTRNPDSAGNPDLANALSALVKGEAPPVTETIVRGCTVKRVGG